MKALIIGLGSIGQRHLQNIVNIYGNKVEIHSYREKSGKFEIKEGVKTKKKIQEKYNIKEHNNLTNAIKAKPNFVLICNPSAFHEKFINIAIKNNLNFFVEKPAVILTKNIVKIAKNINKKKLITMVGFQQRFNPILIEIKKIIKNKSLGKVINADFKWHTYLPDHHKYENYKNSYAAKKALGGGVVFSLIHEIDIIQWFFGKPKRLISCKNNTKKINIECVENIQALMFYKKKKTDFSILLSLSFTEKFNERKFKIIFEKGTIVCDLDENFYKIYNTNKILKSKKIRLRKNNLFKEEIQSFVNSVKKKNQPNVTFIEGTKSVIIAEKIIESSKKNKLINL